MSNFRSADFERACPVCLQKSYTNFASQQIDESKIGEFTYSSRKLPEFMCLRLVICSNCELVYAPSPPEIDYLHAAYKDAGYDSDIESHCAANSYMAALAPFIEKLTQRGLAVDVGAGSGAMLAKLLHSGFNPVVGIEPSRAAIEAATSELKPFLREEMFSPDSLHGLKPSLICSFMTLEHMPDPSTLITSAYEQLAPGGMLAVVVHNWKAPLNRLLGLHSPIIDVEHLQLFCPEAVSILMKRAGFGSVEWVPLRNTYPMRYWLRLTPLPISIKERMAGILKILGALEMNLSLSVGNIMAVGVK